jgi:antitoxin component YwqK of YwqJK toxin-antitoxin module
MLPAGGALKSIVRRPAIPNMFANADLNLAEVPYESGEVRYRYSRVLSPDGTRWLRHGLFVEYQKSGATIAEGQYVLGQEHGEWKYFHPNGTLAAIGQYEQGAEHGVWRYWNEAGTEEPRVTYVHGTERGA